MSSPCALTQCVSRCAESPGPVRAAAAPPRPACESLGCRLSPASRRRRHRRAGGGAETREPAFLDENTSARASRSLAFGPQLSARSASAAPRESHCREISPKRLLPAGVALFRTLLLSQQSRSPRTDNCPFFRSCINLTELKLALSHLLRQTYTLHWPLEKNTPIEFGWNARGVTRFPLLPHFDATFLNLYLSVQRCLTFYGHFNLLLFL